jgi:hypothetical protein
MTRTIPYFFVVLLLVACNNKGGYVPKNSIYLTGRYVGKEACQENEANNYDLIEIITPSNVGDSIVYQNYTYYNVLKTKGVDTALQRPGTMIGFDARLSTERVSSSGCSVSPSLTFTLYEMTIIDQIPFR